MTNYTLCVEFFDEREEGPSFINGTQYTHIVGHKLFKFSCEKEHVQDLAIVLLKKTLKAPPEYIKATFPKFYALSLTKQYWFHVFEEGYLKKNQVKEEPDFDPSSINLEDHLKEDENSDALLDVTDIFINRDLECINAPPERIDFWEMMGLNDIGVE